MDNQQSTQPADEVQPVQQPPKPKSKAGRVGRAIAQYFTATRIAFIGIFAALSYVLSLLDFPLLPGTPIEFLKLDFSNVPVMLGGFALGPVAGVIICVLKELLHALTVGHTAFVGEAANVIMALAYMLYPAIRYKKHKNLVSVYVSLIVGGIIQLIVSFFVNWQLTFPAFMWAFGRGWEGGKMLFLQVCPWVLIFNTLKSLIITVITLFLYKFTGKLVETTNKKFSAMNKKHIENKSAVDRGEPKV